MGPGKVNSKEKSGEPRSTEEIVDKGTCGLSGGCFLHTDEKNRRLTGGGSEGRGGRLS